MVTAAQRVREAVRATVSTFAIPAAQVAWSIDGTVEQIEVGSAAPDTPFPLASVTKVATASLALQIVGDGGLDLDEPIAKLLHSGAGEALGEITLRQLLSHSSGMENEHSSGRTDFASPRDFVAACAGERLLFPPGAHFSYANAGYVVAGHLVEQALELPWAEAVQAFLLDPLEVRGTYFLTRPAGPRALPDAHLRRPDGRVVSVVPSALGRAWAPAGGMALDARGLLRLVALHLDGGRTDQGIQLLEPSLVAEARTAQVPVPDRSFGDAWGLGWALLGEGAWFGHDGTGEGFAAHVRASAREGFAVAMLANCVPVDGEWRRLLRALAAAGLEVGDPDQPSPAAAAPPIDPAVVGRYANGTARWSVEQREDRFRLRLGEQADELRPAGPDRCVGLPADGGVPYAVVFLRDGDGRVRYLHCGGRIARREGGV